MYKTCKSCKYYGERKRELKNGNFKTMSFCRISPFNPYYVCSSECPKFVSVLQTELFQKCQLANAPA